MSLVANRYFAGIRPQISTVESKPTLFQFFSRLPLAKIQLIAVFMYGLAGGLHPTQRKSWSVGTFTAMTGMCSSGRYPLVLKHRWGVCHRGGETLVKPCIAPPPRINSSK